MMHQFNRVVIIGLMVLSTTQVVAKPRTTAGVTTMVEQELLRMDQQPNCDLEHGRCTTVSSQPADKTEIPVVIDVDTDTNTIRMHIDRLFAPVNGKLSPDTAIRLLTFNDQLTAAKLSWEPKTKTVRLWATLNIDTNFDRQAFRSLFKGLISVIKTVIQTIDPTHRPTSSAKK